MATQGKKWQKYLFFFVVVPSFIICFLINNHCLSRQNVAISLNIMKNKSELLKYVSYVVDDALSEHSIDELTGDTLSHARFVGWQCGFEPLVVAVISYLPETFVDSEEAEEIAKDLLIEKKWFGESGEREADFIF